MDYSPFLTPAIAASVFLYFVNFFGKTISDQMSFTDDRKWHIQLSGMMYMTNMAIGVVGVALAIKFPWHSFLHVVTITVLSCIYGSIFFYGKKETARLYNHRKKEWENADKKLDGLLTYMANFGSYLGLGIVPVVVFYFATLEYLNGNIYWMIPTAALSLWIFIQLAFNWSLRGLKDITPVTIYFVDDKNPPIVGVHILKMNDDNIRCRVEDKIIIINKSEVLKIEQVIPEHLQ